MLMQRLHSTSSCSVVSRQIRQGGHILWRIQTFGQGGNLVCFHVQMLRILVLVDNGQFKLTVKEEHGPDELLCFVVEGGYIQAWSIASFANFWLSIIIIMIIIKKLDIAPDKLHECSTITEVISHCVLQKLLPTIFFTYLGTFR